MACFLTVVIMSGVDEQGFWNSGAFAEELSAPGVFSTAQSLELYYRWWDLPVLFVVGLAGGLVGALFNHVNHKFLIFRKRNIHKSKCNMLLEAMFVSVLSSLVLFALPLFFGECAPLPAEENRIEGTSFVTFYCTDSDENGPYYNQLATLTFTGFDGAIKQLFYFRNEGNTGPVCVYYYSTRARARRLL